MILFYLLFFANPAPAYVELPTKLRTEEMISSLRMTDRISTSYFLRDIFGLDSDGTKEGDAVYGLVYSQHPFFSGPCFSNQGSFCSERFFIRDTAPRHSPIREGYRMQACGQIVKGPGGVQGALAKVGLRPGDPLSDENIARVSSPFFSGITVRGGDIPRTLTLVRATEKKEGAPAAWSDLLLLLCSSVGWQIF